MSWSTVPGMVCEEQRRHFLVDDQLGIIDLNIRALSDLTLHFLPGMVARGRGGVLNLGSIASFTPGPNMAVYYASKSFVRSFSEALHQELRGTGVTVTCVAPGPVATEFLETVRRQQGAAVQDIAQTECGIRGRTGVERVQIPSSPCRAGASAKLAVLAAALIPNAIMLPLISRLQRRSNDPCPCGSGLQYRKCCGAR